MANFDVFNVRVMVADTDAMKTVVAVLIDNNVPFAVIEGFVYVDNIGIQSLAEFTNGGTGSDKESG